MGEGSGGYRSRGRPRSAKPTSTSLLVPTGACCTPSSTGSQDTRTVKTNTTGSGAGEDRSGDIVLPLLSHRLAHTTWLMEPSAELLTNSTASTRGNLPSVASPHRRPLPPSISMLLVLVLLRLPRLSRAENDRPEAVRVFVLFVVVYGRCSRFPPPLSSRYRELMCKKVKSSGLPWRSRSTSAATADKTGMAAVTAAVAPSDATSPPPAPSLASIMARAGEAVRLELWWCGLWLAALAVGSKNRGSRRCGEFGDRARRCGDRPRLGEGESAWPRPC